MAKDRVQASVNVKQSAKGKREVLRVKKSLRDIQAEAKKASAAKKQAKKSGPSGTPILGAGVAGAAGAAAFRSRLRSKLPTLTSEGLQFGAFKFSDTGFMVEGLASRVGGPLLASAALGRVAAKAVDIVADIRDARKEAARFGVEFSVTDAAIGATGKRGVELSQGVGTAFGFTQLGGSLRRLLFDESEEEAAQEVARRFNLLKREFMTDADEKIQQRKIERLANKKVDKGYSRLRQLYMAQVRSWGLPADKLQAVEDNFETWAMPLKQQALKQEVDELKALQEHGLEGVGI